MKTAMKCISLLLLLTAFVFPVVSWSQHSSNDKRIVDDAKEAKESFIKTDALMKNLFDKSYGYVLFPNVGKGAVGVGGAAGNGAVYENQRLIGMAKMIQVSVGFQFGGQAYQEVIFFENKAALDHFKDNKLEFSAQASAIAAKAGGAANVTYRDGILVFTQAKGGLMLEAAIGGQKFTYKTD
jgi:lipid-binding SYLF domain-containing protein